MNILKRTAGIFLAVATALTLVAAAMLFTGRADYSVYIVESESMAPEIPVGSIVVVDHESDIQEGDVISFYVGDSENVTTHRLIAVNDDGTIVTQGDAMEQVDPFPATTDDIIGEVVAVYPNLGQFVVFLSTPAGFASMALVVVAGGLALSLLSGRRGEDDDESDGEPVPTDQTADRIEGREPAHSSA